MCPKKCVLKKALERNVVKIWKIALERQNETQLTAQKRDNTIYIGIRTGGYERFQTNPICLKLSGYTVLLPYRERPYREQIVIFREIISSRIGNKSKIRVTQASFSLNWVTICTKTWKPFFEIVFKVLKTHTIMFL